MYIWQLPQSQPHILISAVGWEEHTTSWIFEESERKYILVQVQQSGMEPDLLWIKIGIIWSMC
jgi:hypothetical protein